jgi:hypothetical protein
MNHRLRKKDRIASAGRHNNKAIYKRGKSKGKEFKLNQLSGQIIQEIKARYHLK